MTDQLKAGDIAVGQNFPDAAADRNGMECEVIEGPVKKTVYCEWAATLGSRIGYTVLWSDGNRSHEPASQSSQEKTARTRPRVLPDYELGRRRVAAERS